MLSSLLYWLDDGMSGVALEKVAAFCNRLLQPEAFGDWEGAVNGLQVSNRGRVHRVAAAVDARQATIERAGEGGADLLLVHHGLFWGATVPWTGARYRLMRALIEHDLAVYSSHLPLDAHPRLGNNVLLARALGLHRLSPFFEQKGRPIGVRSLARLSRDALRDRLAAVTGGRVTVLAGGGPLCRRIGVVTGGAGGELRQAAAEGIDAFVTGEGPHWTHALAEELGLNVFYAGHYATETFGVKALAAAVSRRFRLPWTFLDYPTGL